MELFLVFDHSWKWFVLIHRCVCVSEHLGMASACWQPGWAVDISIIDRAFGVILHFYTHGRDIVWHWNTKQQHCYSVDLLIFFVLSLVYTSIFNANAVHINEWIEHRITNVISIHILTRVCVFMLCCFEWHAMFVRGVRGALDYANAFCDAIWRIEVSCIFLCAVVRFVVYELLAMAMRVCMLERK